MHNYKEKIEAIMPSFLDDLRLLVRIPSVKDTYSAKNGQPFGTSISQAMDCFQHIAERLGFDVHQDDGYAIDARTGNSDKYVGILGHLDVINIYQPEKWLFNPFELTEKDGILYGRGVNDDKGPLLMCLYATKILRELKVKFKYPIRVIAGGDEESDWECVKHYFNTHSQPLMAFSPDGNFPVVNGEKGIVQFRFELPYNGKSQIVSHNPEHTICDKLEVNGIIYTGKRALSRNPQRAENAIFKFVSNTEIPADLSQITDFIRMFLTDTSAAGLQLDTTDSEMGSSSIGLTHMYTRSGRVILKCDYRYPKTTNRETVIAQLQEFADLYAIDLIIEQAREYLFVPADDKLVQACLKAYQSIMGTKAVPITKGGASYARALHKGIAFGATFEYDDPQPHMPNEKMTIESIKKAMEIYIEAIYNLVS